ncbi:MAG: ABC transporter ATP-binding protein [Gemmatimonadetes bacterium]|nr:ABC transporter ATP-binding protein [Gemmatimonadota bacterium]
MSSVRDTGRAAGTERAPDGLVLEARNVCRSFPSGDRTLEVLRGVDVELRAGEIVAVLGPSGSGKSTLLHCLGGLDRPTAGTIRIGGQDLASQDDGQLAAIRNREVGFVFQFHHLLPDFSAVENVMLPQMIAGVSSSRARERAEQLLGEVGLAERLDHAPGELSGGEQQRVAVSRALANRPSVVLADEPSGNLDVASSASLHDLLDGLRREHGVTFLIATHDLDLAGKADRVLTVADGRLVAGTAPGAAPQGAAR